MFPKAHLTSHSRMSGSRWVITALWFSRSLRPVLCSSSVHSCHLFLISSAFLRSLMISVVYHAHPCMKCSLGISSFCKEISSLSHSVVFLYLFGLFIKNLLFSTCYSLELCIHLSISFPFSLAFHFSSFLSHLYSLLKQLLCLLAYFSWEWFWSPLPVQCYKPPSIILQADSSNLSTRSNPLNLFVTSTV